MKKVINGKMYNTETAKEVGYWNNGCPRNNFNWCSETLYKKKTGEFFIYGEGGALSKYSEAIGHALTGGESIVPISYKEAQKWAEKNLDGEDYEKIFGEVEE